MGINKSKTIRAQNNKKTGKTYSEKNSQKLKDKSNNPPRCKYRLPAPKDKFPPEEYDSEYSCSHLSYEGNQLCIFHVKKFTESERKNLKIQKRINAIAAEFDFGQEFSKLVTNAIVVCSKLIITTNTPQLITNISLIKKLFLDFRGFHFPRVEFPNVTFPVYADFRESIFNENVDFSEETRNQTVVQKYNDYTSHLLFNGANFYNAEFREEASFMGEQINNQISFNEATFKGFVNFSGLTVKDDALFIGAVFKDLADFSAVYFKRANFSGASFEKETIFDWMRIGMSGNFINTQFHTEAYFPQCRFGTHHSDYYLNGESDKHTEKERKAHEDVINFSQAIFYEGLTFQETDFFCDVSFFDVSFIKKTKFIGDGARVFYKEVFFYKLKVPKEEKIIFEDLDLGKAGFNDTNLEKIIFRDVKWGNARTLLQKIFRRRGYILRDEIGLQDLPDDYPNEEKTAENYSELVLNYERKRDFESAEYFHIGEMEMRRKRVGKKKKFFPNYSIEDESKPSIFFSEVLIPAWEKIREYVNGYSIYLITSRYGTSYGQAFVVSFLLIILFSSFFLFAGIKTSQEKDEKTSRIIEYNIYSDETHKPTTLDNFIYDFGEAVLYTLSIITFQREKFYKPLDWQARYLFYLTFFIITAQSALVLLAIRRRFKR